MPNMEGVRAANLARFLRNQEAVLKIVLAGDGVRLADICRQTGMAKTSVTTHLRALKESGRVTMRLSDNVVLYFGPGGGLDLDHKPDPSGTFVHRIIPAGQAVSYRPAKPASVFHLA